MQEMDLMQKKGLINTHHVLGVVSELELHVAFYKICTVFREA